MLGWEGSPSCPSCSIPSPLTPLQAQKTMKENLAIVEDNFADIEARIKRLQK